MLKGVSETNEKKKHNDKEVDFFLLLGTLGATLLGSKLSEITGKVITRTGDGVFQAGREPIIVSESFWCCFIL